MMFSQLLGKDGWIDVRVLRLVFSHYEGLIGQTGTMPLKSSSWEACSILEFAEIPITLQNGNKRKEL